MEKLKYRVWLSLTNAKFKSLFMSRYISIQKTKERNIEWFLAFTSSGSVAAWWIFDWLPVLWALVVVLSQILGLSKKYMLSPYSLNKLYSLQTHYESKYREYDFLWLDISLGRLSTEELNTKYRELEDRFYEESKEYADVNIQNKELAMKIDPEWQSFLKRKYNIK